MGNARVTFLNTEDIISRESPFNLQFKIERPIMDSDSTFSYPMTEGSTIVTGLEWLSIVKKSEWDSISNFSTEVIDVLNILKITGRKKIKYRYKVEVAETGTLLKNWTAFTDINEITDTSIILTKESFETWSPYNIRVTIEQDDGLVTISQKQFRVYDTEPFLEILNVDNNILNYQIGDLESDSVRYRIKLNGVVIFPTSGDFTGLTPTPAYGSILLPREHVKVEEANSLVLEVKDSYDMLTVSTPVTFIGEYRGIIFVDELGEVLTTDLGAIRKLLDYGLVTAGRTSNILRVDVKNMTGYDIQNLKLTLNEYVRISSNIPVPTDSKSIPDLTKVWISKDNSNFIEDNKELLYPETISNGDSRSFYLKVSSDIFAVGSGSFGIDAIATPV